MRNYSIGDGKTISNFTFLKKKCIATKKDAIKRIIKQINIQSLSFFRMNEIEEIQRIAVGKKSNDFELDLFTLSTTEFNSLIN